MFLSDKEKEMLLFQARESITERLVPSGRRPEPVQPTETLLQKSGAFVSLYVEGKLRGCIGTFSEDESLMENVRSMAISAAQLDSRFTPIQQEDLGDLKIEISVLTPRKKIDDIGEIILGKHGIYLRKGMNRGTLLPQVALNQEWSVIEFLGNCSKYKAGIGWDGWKTAEIYIYEAIVFNSEDQEENC